VRLIITKWEPWHIAAMAMHDLSFQDNKWTVKEFEGMSYFERIRANASAGPAFSGLSDGYVIGMVGIVPYWPGVGELWMAATTLAPRVGYQVTQQLLERLDLVAREYEFERVQAFIPEDSTYVMKLLHRLGFEVETKQAGMKRFSMDGTACHLFAKVYEPCLQPQSQ
jgi:hypothetical protein